MGEHSELIHVLTKTNNDMKQIKITPQMSDDFKSRYESSNEPIFKISQNGEVTHGCRAIAMTDKAVFIYVSSFLCCFGFWMPIDTYKTMRDGYIKPTKRPLNFNNTLYTY